jgi:hypothetical protein
MDDNRIKRGSSESNWNAESFNQTGVTPNPEVGGLNEGGKTHKVKVIAKAISASFVSIGAWMLTAFDPPTPVNKRSKIAINNVHQNDKLNSSFFHLSIGSSFISPLRNVAKREIFDTDRVATEANILLRICENGQGSNLIPVNADVTPHTAQLDGICAGFRIDVAANYLINKKDVHQILQNNLKGANAEAAANQAVYSILSKGSHLKLDTEAHYENSLFTPLSKLDQTEFFYRDVLIGLNFLCGNDVLRKMSLDKGSVIDKENDKIAAANKSITNIGPLSMILFNIVGDIKKKLLDKTELNNFFKEIGIDKPQIDVEKLKKFLADKIHNTEPPLKREELEKTTHSLDILIACLEMRNAHQKLKSEKTAVSAPIKPSEISSRWEKFKQEAIKLFGTAPPEPKISPHDYISNPAIGYQFKAICTDELNRNAHEVVCQARQLTQKAPSIGHSSACSSDLEFLDKFKELPAGFYGLGISAGNGRHAISYIKHADGSGYILDPNYGAVKCRDDAHTIKLFQKLLSEYPESKHKSPLAKQAGQPHHQISIWKMEEAAKQ